MTNTEHVYDLVKQWVKDHQRPIMAKDLVDQGVPDWHAKKGINTLIKLGKLKKAVKKGYILIA